MHHVKGSHHVLRHPAKPKVRAVVPVHRKDLPVGTLRAIIRQAGLSVEETANALEVSARTVKREWCFARAWLSDALREAVS